MYIEMKMTLRRGTLALLAALIFTSLASAQSTETPPKKPTNNWAVNCGAAQSGGTDLVCRMVQNLIVQETKQRLLSVIISPQTNAKDHILTLILPHGMNFAQGVTLQVDEKEARRVAISTSNPQGAFVNQVLNGDLLEELRGGRAMKISFSALSGQTFNLPISLIGFTAAFNKLTPKSE